MIEMKKVKVWLLAIALLFFITLGGCTATDSLNETFSGDFPQRNNTINVTLEHLEGSKTLNFTEDSQAITFVSDYVEYSVINGEAIVSWVLSQNRNVIIPSRVEGYPVTTIAAQAFYQNCCETVELPDTIKSIEGGAFYCCYYLKEIEIPANVQTIGSDAFFRASSLRGIYVHPENSVFTDVSGVLYTSDKTKLVFFPEGLKLEKYVIPDGVVCIGDVAFGYNPGAKKIVFYNDSIDMPDGPLAAILDDMIFVAPSDSTAAKYAKEYGIDLQ